MKTTPLVSRLLRTGALLALPFLATGLHAQAQFAGTYTGTVNTKVTAPVIGSIESGAGAYIATVSAAGGFDLGGGLLTGTVSAAGAVTITGGTSLASLGIRSATIANNQLSSAYGDVLGNGTTQFKLNGSTSFTAASGGGTGGGGTGGGTATAWQNGSFEGGPNPGAAWITLSVGSTAINGWTVTSGSVDYIGTAWSSSHGTRSLDLSGISAGTIAQTFTTTAGVAYTVTFDYAGNPGYGAGTGVKRTRVSVNNTAGTSQDYTFDTTGRTLANMGWTTQTFIFTASAATTTLSFASQEDSAYGPALDNVKLNGSSGETSSVAAAAGTTTVTGTTAATAPASLTSYRNKVGSTFEFTVTGTASGSAWGTDVYTDDSNVGVAAVHAGVLGAGQTKVVTVYILPGQASYTASTRNGVTTGAWGAWSGSFSFAGGTGASGTATAAPSLAVSASTVNVARTISFGSSLVLTVPISGVGPFTYQWFLNGIALSGATSASYSLASVTAANVGTYSVRVTNSAGSSTIAAGSVAVSGTAVGVPVINLQPFNKVVSPGGTFALATSATGSGLSYLWFRNLLALTGETGSVLLRQNVNANDAGSYTVRVSNSFGSITSAPAIVTLDANAAVIANISVRVAAVEGQLITLGFTIAGAGKKRLLIRAVGSGLEPYLPGADLMKDPTLTVFEGTTAIPGFTNNDWSSSLASTFAAIGAFPLTTGSKDAAIVVDLDASATGRGYSVQGKGTGTNGTSGIVLLEIYDLGNPTGASKLSNVSVLSRAAFGDSTLILGLVLRGSGQRTLLVRGVGPSLAAYGVTDRLTDPKLSVIDVNQRTVISNLDWGQADYLSELVLATNYVTPFALADRSTDAATLALLEAGSYTIPVVGQDGGTGQTLIEVYEVP